MLKFSIIIPLFNKEQYLSRAVTALFNQTYLPHEIIIIDDASTDNSLQVVKACLAQYSDDFPDVSWVVIQNESNMGPGASRNTGIELATGDYLLFLDADDEYLPMLLEKTSELITQKGADMVILGFRRLPENNIKPTWKHCPSWLEQQTEDYYLLTHPLDIVLQRELPLGPGSNAVVRKSVLAEIRYDETSYVFEGIDFWFRVLKKVMQMNGRCFLLKGPYHHVYTIMDSLIRKKIVMENIHPPYLLTRYASSTDYYEKKLLIRTAKIWLKHDFSRLSSLSQKAQFLWRFKYLFIHFLNKTSK